MGRICILEPPGSREDARGISGGFLYNRSLASDTVENSVYLYSQDSSIDPGDLALFDSLYWYNRLFLDSRPILPPDQLWGVLLHGLPPDPQSLFDDLQRANIVVVPSLWLAQVLTQELAPLRSTRIFDEEGIRSTVDRADPNPADQSALPLVVLYPGWDTHGPDLLQLTPTRPPSAEPEYRFASLGRVSKEKGHLLASEALASLGDLPWQWIVAGPGNSEIETQIRDQLGTRFVAQGILEPKKVPEFLKSIDVLVQPSLAETFSMAVYEAAAAGCGVVALDRGGVPEALALGKALGAAAGDARPARRRGILVPADDGGDRALIVSALAQAIPRALEFDETPENPRPELKALLSWAGRRNRLCSLVNQLLEPSPGGNS